MRKRLITFGIAVLLVVGWMVGDDDPTPITDAADRPPAPTSTPDQPDEGTSGDATPTTEPATPRPTAQDRKDPDTDTSETEQNGLADSENDRSEPNALTDKVAALPVADDNRTGYDRDEFGDYDRDALLEESLRDHGCYLSLADDQCYDDPAEVHADHIVALAEAWRSGLAESDTDAIAEDPDNLWLMTASVNMSKSEDDPAAWLPPDDGAVCAYIAAYVEIKIEYSLTVDPAELDALADATANC